MRFVTRFPKMYILSTLASQTYAKPTKVGSMSMLTHTLAMYRPANYVSYGVLARRFAPLSNNYFKTSTLGHETVPFLLSRQSDTRSHVCCSGISVFYMVYVQGYVARMLAWCYVILQFVTYRVFQCHVSVKSCWNVRNYGYGKTVLFTTHVLMENPVCLNLLCI